MPKAPWPDNLCPMCGIDYKWHRHDGRYDCWYAQMWMLMTFMTQYGGFYVE